VETWRFVFVWVELHAQFPVSLFDGLLIRISLHTQRSVIVHGVDKAKK